MKKKAKVFSSRNLQAIKKFYLMYSKILPQVAAESQSSNLPFLPDNFKSALPSIEEIEAKLKNQ